MRGYVHRLWPAIPALVLLWLGIAVIMFKFFERSDATHLVYSLDDAYIHMAIAKHLADLGVYGITKREFSSSSSSPLWVIVLFLCSKLIDLGEMAPFLLNVVLASASLGAASSVLGRHIASRPLVSLGVLACLSTAFVLPLVFSGMEHIAQMFLVTVFCYTASLHLVSERRGGVLLVAVAFLLPVTRYESLFVVGLVVLLLLVRQRYRVGLLVAIFAVLPVGLYATVSISAGSLAFPNPILVKGVHPNLLDPNQALAFATSGIRSLQASPHVLGLAVLLLLTLLLVSAKGRIWSTSNCMLFLSLSSILCHAQFARMSDPLHRYEAHLFFLGVISICIALGDADFGRAVPLARARAQPIRAFALGVLVFLMAYPVLSRNLYWLRLTHVGMRNIYEQQYQMGLFLREYYTDQGVALNDIGAVNYLADIRMLDLVGLANVEVARLWLDRSYTTASIEALTSARNIRVAVVYDHWFSDAAYLPPLPATWQKAGEWTITSNVVCGGPTVSFYATSKEDLPSLVRHLKNYSRRLPTAVREDGLYMEGQ